MGSQIVGQVVAVPGLQWTVSDDDAPVPGGPLFWIYVDQQGRWCLRREGGESEAAGAVLLRSHGRSLAIGRFLSPEERVRLREALALALARLREPRFD